MDKDLQRIEGKIDALTDIVAGNTQDVKTLTEVVADNTQDVKTLTEVVAGNTKGIQNLAETVGTVLEVVTFMTDRMVTKAELKEEVTKLATKGEMKMLEGHMNVIEQKLDTSIDQHKHLEVRVTRLESAPAH
jgi:hypothetical protein